ncbi:MAG: N-(5'-phosphoribosyl)anthranilate isomerase, partial [Maioricimonas sp. JB049]
MWVKICGLTDRATAEAVADLGASAIGLNFYAPSPRAVTPAVARGICRHVASKIEVVGLFVNHPLEVVREIVSHCGLTTVQLHGNESPEYVARLAETARLDIIRVYRVGASGLDEARSDLQQ